VLGRLPSWLLDAGLAVAFGALGLADVFARLAAPSGPSAPARSAVVPVLVVATALAFRRRAPLGTVVVIAAAVVLPTLPFEVRLVYWGEFAPWLFALYSLGRYASRRRALVGLAVSVAAFAGLAAQYVDLREPGNALYDIGLMVVVCVVGMVVRHRAALRQENDRLEHEQEVATERGIAEERARIARELHDVIAHGIGLIVLQAGGARLGFDRDPEAAREALRRIETAGRASLTELRLLLEVLRPGEVTDETGGTEPQPTVQRLEDLVAESRDRGLPVSLTVDPGAAELPLGMQLSAYRIVQEALTNVAKHAGNAPTTVSIGCNGSLVVDVCNDASRGTSTPPTRGGHGLLGMSERVAVLGGMLSSGPTPEGGFRVRADIPLPGGGR
jgi:signal transduction histidine kinase